MESYCSFDIHEIVSNVKHVKIYIYIYIVISLPKFFLIEFSSIKLANNFFNIINLTFRVCSIIMSINSI